jgi:hypothetical protein
MLDGRPFLPAAPAGPAPSYHQLRAPELAAVIGALAASPAAPRPDELADILEASYNQLMHFSPAELCALVSALAAWGAAPGEAWLERFEGRAYQACTDASGDQVATFVWGFAQLGHRPDLALDALLDAAADALPGYSPASMAGIVWALAKLEAPPPQAWAQALLRASRAQLLQFPPAELAKLLWGLAKLGLRPGAEWMGAFLAAAQVQLGGFGPKSLSLAVWALATLGYRPDRAWLQALERQAAAQVAQFGAQEMTCLLWGMAQLTQRRQEELLSSRLHGQQGFAELDFDVLQSPKLLGVIMSLRQGNGSCSSG